MAKLLDLLLSLPIGTKVYQPRKPAISVWFCFEKHSDFRPTLESNGSLERADFIDNDWIARTPVEVWTKVTRVQARNLLSKGRVVRRKCWTDPGQNLGGIFLRNGSIVYRKSGLFCNCLHRLFDKTANDWEVLLGK